MVAILSRSPNPEKLLYCPWKISVELTRGNSKFSGWVAASPLMARKRYAACRRAPLERQSGGACCYHLTFAAKTKYNHFIALRYQKPRHNW
jgi:hypothetical protein